MIDPRTKIFMVFCLSVGAFASDSSAFALLVVAAYSWWSYRCGLSPWDLVRRLRKVALFLTVIIATDACTTNGRVLTEFVGLYVTAEGIRQGIGHASKLLIVLWGGTLLAASTPLEDVVDAAEQWGRSHGRPLLAVATVAMNCMPLLVGSARRVKLAGLARGEDGGVLGGVRMAAVSALPLVAASVRDAGHLAEAMESRSYDPVAARRPYRTLTISLADRVLMTCAFATSLAAVLGFL
jgi:energy-coupling factor transporter transmembrane protein EcfT